MDLSLNRFIASTLAVVLAVFFGAGSGATARPQSPDPDCHACLAVAEDGTVLFQRRADLPLPNASTTKIVTALVVRQEGLSLDEEVRVSATAAAAPPVRIALVEGDRFSVRELLTALLLGSSNQAAVALAERVAGGEPAFVARMNEMAGDLGAKATTFSNPHGLDAPGHGSSAKDLALFGAELLEDPFLSELVALPEAVLTSPARSLEVENTNELLGGYDGLIGIKTGFTADAGRVLVAAAERDGRRVIAVAMGSNDAFAAAQTLLDHAFERLARGILLAKMTPMTDVVFDSSGALTAVTSRNVRGSDLPETVTVRFVPGRDLEPPLSAGERVGTAIVEDDSGRSVGTSPVVTLAAGGESRDTPWFARLLSGLLSGAAVLLPGERP